MTLWGDPPGITVENNSGLQGQASSVSQTDTHQYPHLTLLYPQPSKLNARACSMLDFWSQCQHRYLYKLLKSIYLSIYTLLKGYSGVNLIHGLTHRETVLDSLSRVQVSNLRTAAGQQYIAVNGSKYKPPPKSHK